MDVADFCRQSHVVIVIGKGGVGKTTVSAALARAGADAGLDVLVTALDDANSLPRLFDHNSSLDYEETPLYEAASGGAVRARVLRADDALLEYLEDHGLGRISKRLVSTGALDVIATAIPGVRDVLVLGKVKQLERDRAADLIVLDAPASGHAVSLLTSATGLFSAARGGPLRSQAEQVLEMLGDPRRCQALLVTIPEETPVNEAAETAYQLEDIVGIYLGPIVINACYERRALIDSGDVAFDALVGTDLATRDSLRKAAEFRRRRDHLQKEQLERLSELVALAQIELPYVFDSDLAPDMVATLAEHFATGLSAL
jgi:anion-transporting  ArsA/GET3 family ATPase